MNVAAWRRVNDMVVGCTLTTFETAGFPVAPVETPAQAQAELTNVAVIGFGGRHFRGAVLFAASDELLVRILPKAAQQDGAVHDTLLDWSGELLNQLVGRIKSELLQLGVTIEPGIPTTVTGIGVRVGAATRNAHCVPHLFELGGDYFIVRFEALAEPGASLADEPDPSLSAGAAGDLLLF
jgi:hypothetical protein